MSKGNDSRVSADRQERDREGRTTAPGRSSRSSVRMTVERARAIQAAADRGDQNQDFKARAMAAAAQNAASDEDDT